MVDVSASIPVVINADDFGYSEFVNRSIARSLELGRISSSTIMANAPAALEALEIAKCHPEASFGIHLNLTEFAPLTGFDDWQRLGLLNVHGHFNGNIRQLAPSPLLIRAVSQEWDAQIRFLRARGLRPSHLDSHHHVHTIAWLLPVLAWLQRRHRLPCLRNTLSIYPDTYRPSKPLRVAKLLWTSCCGHLIGSRLPVVFAAIEEFWMYPDRQEFLRAPGIELMCHPGQNGFESETAQLLRDDLPPLPKEYVLVPFAQACSTSPLHRSLFN